MEMNKKKYFLYLGMTLLFLIVVVGVSYAAYTFIGTGTTENVITTGQINVAFEEKNNILISNRYPETDTAGLANTDPNSQMTFTVSSDIVGDAVVDYAVGLVEIEEGDTLTQEDIKIYLTKSGSPTNGFTSGEGRTIEEFKDAKIEGFLDSHMIAQGSLTKTKMHTYDLKAWINETYKLPKDESMATDENGGFVTTISEEFSFKIKVVATNVQTYTGSGNLTEPETPVLASNMIPVMYDGENWVKADITNENPDYAWYSYTNKQWANAVTVTDYEVSEKSATEESPKAKLLNSSTLTREQLVNLPVGSVIPMERINTMWVWIPRFSAEVAYSYNFEVIDLFEIEELSNSDKDSMINDYCVTYNGNDENYCTTTMNTLIAGGTDEYGDTLKHWFLNHATNIEQGNYASDETLENEFKITSNVTYNIKEEHKEEMVSDICIELSGETKEECTKMLNDAINNGEDEHGNSLLGYYISIYNMYDNFFGSKLRYGSFNISFVGTDEEAHDAFTFGEDDLPGFWVGKFETSDEDDYAYCDNRNCGDADEILILPYKASLRYTDIQNSFYSSRSVEKRNSAFGLNYTEVDTHMMKNNEWGAVSYLTYSQYGRCTSPTECEVVEANENGKIEQPSPSSNKNSIKYNIKLLVTDSGCGTNASTGGCDYKVNVNQSTTGNIYGIYDMVGGASEYVAGVIEDMILYLDEEIKYFNTYTPELPKSSADLQHALYETKKWYRSIFEYIDYDYPCFVRGGVYSEPNRNIFSSAVSNGNEYKDISFRITLANVEEERIAES